MGVASLVLGIISILICWIPCVGWFAFIPAIVGAILGLVDMIQKKKNGEKRGIAIAGFVLCVIAIIVPIIYIIAVGGLAAIGTASSYM